MLGHIHMLSTARPRRTKPALHAGAMRASHPRTAELAVSVPLSTHVLAKGPSRPTREAREAPRRTRKETRNTPAALIVYTTHAHHSAVQEMPFYIPALVFSLYVAV